VVGPHDADPWTFRVIGREKVQAGAAIGAVDTVHVLREPPPGSKDQTLDIWLAPSLEWYPVKLRFVDNDRDYVEQTLEKLVTRRRGSRFVCVSLAQAEPGFPPARERRSGG
jgi:hypothetical protein